MMLRTLATLRPLPLGVLLRRMLDELRARQSIFDLRERSFFAGEPELDLSVRFHGKRAASPLGPAAGPQSQMAQNLVLAWLGGSRILELKTVQIRDDLVIPRPCIDAETVGYNIEWSQELTLEESLEEYVKGAMLIEVLKAGGDIPVLPGFGDTIFDMSVGYDLAGIESERVQTFVRGMLDARAVVDRLRSEIPHDLRRFRDLDFPERLSDTLTLSTFHGCPSHEIERIVSFLLRENRLHCIVKLNPMLLGPVETRRLLHDELGYDDLVVPDSAFQRDTKWPEMEAFVERLADTAASLGLGFGVKLSNTLIVENHRSFFPGSEKEMYLSGQPLHVLAMQLVRRFRERFGTKHPISFAAGIDKANFADAVALGLVPVTVCTDLLRPGGYARQRGYLQELARRMREVFANTVDEFVLRAYGQGDPGSSAAAADGARRRAEAAAPAGTRSSADAAAPSRDRLDEAMLRNTRIYVERATADPRYKKAANSKPPKKIGRRLSLFDCITCDKCVPVCPNDANFALALPPEDIPSAKLRFAGGRWVEEAGAPIRLAEKHQIGNFADFCNDCGNCDVFCPEDGGPYVLKPRFFGSEAAWRADGRDGFFLARGEGAVVVLARAEAREMRAEFRGDGTVRFAGPGFDVELDPADPLGTIRGEADGDVDLGWLRILDRIRAAVLSDTGVSWPSAVAS
ncbi:MAG: glutamate synthase [Candidatus Eiseniibacteriota bacterium]